MATSAKRRRPGPTPDVVEAATILIELSRRSFARIMVPAENERNMEHDTTTETMIMPSSSSEDLTRSEQNQPTTEKEEDDSEETLNLLLRWITDMPRIPPENIFSMVGQRCSKPIRKQLTSSDVKKDQNRLMLGKRQVEMNFLPLLEQSEIRRLKEGIKVTVYGPDGDVQEMMFKKWNKKTPVLMSGSGWHNFVQKYELHMHCCFLTIWMFRRTDSNTLGFAIDCTRHSLITKPLSRRIARIAFKDSI